MPVLEMADNFHSAHTDLNHTPHTVLIPDRWNWVGVVVVVRVCVCVCSCCECDTLRQKTKTDKDEEARESLNHFQICCHFPIVLFLFFKTIF